MTNELSLDILGTSFTITTDQDEEYLKKVLAQYKEAVKNTRNISGISEPLNVAILTGFLLCDEINKLKQQTETEAAEVEQRTLNLITNLEHALKKCANKAVKTSGNVTPPSTVLQPVS